MKEKDLYAKKQETSKDAATHDSNKLFEDLYTRITSKQSREAADKLFSSSSNDFRESFEVEKKR